MASGMPLPIPPRTPTPPPDDSPVGLGLESTGRFSPTKLVPDQDTISPISTSFPQNRFTHLAPGGPPSPTGSKFSYSPYAGSNISGSESETPSLGGPDNARNPFNFQTVQYAPAKVPGKPDIGRRRGHKYKHSSVSHQIFLEPPPRAPLQLPASLPIPTLYEYWSSMSREQSMRGLWCFCHLFIAGLVSWSSHETLALTVLSRLTFFDALGAFLCVAVDVGSNFEVWKRSTIRYPFGIERSEVVASLGMSVGLLFMGLDLISHSLTHVLEETEGHDAAQPHSHAHYHQRITPGSIDFAALSAMVATLVSALVLKNHARIGKVMHVTPIAALPSILSNPSHFLTLSCSTLLLLLPLLSVKMSLWLDRSLLLVFALSMIVLGWRLGWTLGKILMMSYGSPAGVQAVLDDIKSDPAVTAIEEARFWQVHFGMCQANLKLKIRNMDELTRIRERIGSLVRTRLGGGYGTGGAGLKWEVSTQAILDRD